MKEIEISYFNHENKNRLYEEVNTIPDTCPICHNGIVPIPVVASFIDGLSWDKAQYVFRCTKEDCQNLFIAVYKKPSFEYNSQRHMLDYLTPYSVKKEEIEEEILEFSEEFNDIYNQAKAAEARKLHHVAGMGYRKSLEFLIKDYLIKIKCMDEEIIGNTFLGNCIRDYVEDHRIKEVAKIAAWLGNDESHYKRIWTDKDINDLKVLIKLTRFWIVAELQTAKYLESMKK